MTKRLRQHRIRQSLTRDPTPLTLLSDPPRFVTSEGVFRRRNFRIPANHPAARRTNPVTARSRLRLIQKNTITYRGHLRRGGTGCRGGNGGRGGRGGRGGSWESWESGGSGRSGGGGGSEGANKPKLLQPPAHLGPRQPDRLPIPPKPALFPRLPAPPTFPALRILRQLPKELARPNHPRPDLTSPAPDFAITGNHRQRSAVPPPRDQPLNQRVGVPARAGVDHLAPEHRPPLTAAVADQEGPPVRVAAALDQAREVVHLGPGKAGR